MCDICKLTTKTPKLTASSVSENVFVCCEQWPWKMLYPDNIYLFKLTIETVKKGVKYV